MRVFVIRGGTMKGEDVITKSDIGRRCVAEIYYENGGGRYNSCWTSGRVCDVSEGGRVLVRYWFLLCPCWVWVDPSEVELR